MHYVHSTVLLSEVVTRIISLGSSILRPPTLAM